MYQSEHAAELGLQIPRLRLSTRHVNMYGIPRTLLLLFIWDLQSAENENRGVEGGGGCVGGDNK